MVTPGPVSRFSPMINGTLLLLAVMVISVLAYVGAVVGGSMGVTIAGAVGGPGAEIVGVIIGGTFGVALVLVGGGALLARLSRRLGPSETASRPNG